MKKILISIVLVAGIGGLIYVVSYKPDQSSTGATQTTTTSATTSQRYKDGTYQGSVVGNDYGSVQVEATIDGGKISKVTMLQALYLHQHSQELNDYATPILIKESIAAQTAQVDIVSGATEISQGFIESLQVALDKSQS